MKLKYTPLEIQRLDTQNDAHMLKREIDLSKAHHFLVSNVEFRGCNEFNAGGEGFHSNSNIWHLPKDLFVGIPPRSLTVRP